MAYITQKHVWELPFPVYIEKYLVDPSSNMTAKYYSTSVLDPQLDTSNKHILSAYLLNFVQGMRFRNRKCLPMKKEPPTTSESSAVEAVFQIYKPDPSPLTMKCPEETVIERNTDSAFWRVLTKTILILLFAASFIFAIYHLISLYKK